MQAINIIKCSLSPMGVLAPSPCSLIGVAQHPHQQEWKFSSTHFCKVTFKPVRCHTQTFITLGLLLKILTNSYFLCYQTSLWKKYILFQTKSSSLLLLQMFDFHLLIFKVISISSFNIWLCYNSILVWSFLICRDRFSWHISGDTLKEHI